MKNEYKLTLDDLSELVNTDIYNVIYEYWKNCYYCGVSEDGRIFMNDDKLTCTNCLVKNCIHVHYDSCTCYQYIIENKNFPKNYANVICYNTATYLSGFTILTCYKIRHAHHSHCNKFAHNLGDYVCGIKIIEKK